MADVTISYKGASIATMDASGSKTLNTKGKYCEDDIAVSYVAPSSPTKPTQAKSVTPSESAQTVTPDAGYELSQVDVGAIPSNYVGSAVTRKAAATYTPGTADQTIASDQYLAGAQTVKGDTNLVAGNIKSGVTIFGVTGTHSGGTTPSGTVSITENGTNDVTNYASANVNVSAATAFGTHNGWKIAKFHTVSADVGNGATCTIDTGVTATRYMLICMSVKSRISWGLQAAHFSIGSYDTAGVLCLKPSTGQMYGQSTSYISSVSVSGTNLSFTVSSANATVRAGEYLILYQA